MLMCYVLHAFKAMRIICSTGIAHFGDSLALTQKGNNSGILGNGCYFGAIGHCLATEGFLAVSNRSFWSQTGGGGDLVTQGHGRSQGKRGSDGDPVLSHNPMMVVTLRHHTGSIPVRMSGERDGAAATRTCSTTPPWMGAMGGVDLGGSHTGLHPAGSGDHQKTLFSAEGPASLLSGEKGGASPPPAPTTLLPSMGVWHSVFSRGETGLTYVSPKLVRVCVLRWRDLVISGVIKLERLDPALRPGRASVRHPPVLGGVGKITAQLAEHHSETNGSGLQSQAQ